MSYTSSVFRQGRELGQKGAMSPMLHATETHILCRNHQLAYRWFALSSNSTLPWQSEADSALAIRQVRFSPGLTFWVGRGDSLCSLLFGGVNYLCGLPRYTLEEPLLPAARVPASPAFSSSCTFGDGVLVVQTLCL